MLKRDLEFLYEIGSLRNIERTWKQVIATPVATVLEHTLRVVFIALLLARMEGEKDEEKVLKMALVHDLAEARAGDANAVQAVYMTRDEERAAADLFMQTIFADLHEGVLKEYAERTSKIAQIVKDADNLEVDLEIKELEESGSQLPKKWKKTRELVRQEKLYTDSAKKLWDAIQSSDPSAWYMESMKWWKIKNAGK